MSYFNFIVIISLFIFLFISFYVYKNIFIQINGYLFVLLGFAVFVFLDIIKSSIIVFDDRMLEEPTEILTVVFFYLSFILFLIGYHSSKFQILELNTEKSYDSNNFKICPIKLDILIILVILFSPFFIYFFSDSTNNYLLTLAIVPKALLIITLFTYLKYGKKKYLIATIILSLFSLFEVSRRIYVTVFIMALIMILNYVNKKSIEYKRKTKIILTICFVFFFIFLNYLRSEHDFGLGFSPDDKIANTINYIVTLKSIDIFYNTGYTLETVPENFGYLYGTSYLTVLLGFVPRAIWSDKPISYSADLAYRQRTNFIISSTDDWYSVNQYSLSTGFIGEAHANFGYLGIFIFSYLLGFFTKYIDSKNYNRLLFEDAKFLPYISIYPFLVLILRGDFYTASIFPIMLFIWLKILLWLVNLRSIQNPPQIA
jgi:oligosaccharide repeat unit polymerase